MRRLSRWIAVAAAWALAGSAFAQEDSAELAKKLNNPISSLISVPFQNNYDCCYGQAGGGRYTLNFQPVIPITLNQDLTLITRTIVPFISQGETIPGQGGASGFGDITQSFFLSPKAAPGGIIWGAGPVFLWPSGTSRLGSGKWAAGPTVVILKQTGPATIGILANQLWAYAGDSGRPGVNRMFLQPFYAYTYRNSTSITVNTETTYDWIAHQWTVPINFGVSHIYKLGGHPVSLGVQARSYLVRPDGGPGWGARFIATFLFPK